MSIKEVRDYHLRMTSDYLSLKETLDKLESEITPETSTAALANIEQIKKQVARVQENYNRINYIMYLLDMPKRKSKQDPGCPDLRTRAAPRRERAPRGAGRDYR